MKPDYKNWIPKGMLYSLIAGTLLSLVLLLILGVFGIGVSGKLRIALGVVFGIAFVVCAKYTEWCVHAYRSFSYDGERKLSKQIIEGTARYVTLPEGGIGLDVGCGSGALTIACAKRNPQGRMLGIDRWGKEYASFSLPLCEKNAAAEGVKNASFRRGNAVKLDFPDESFDAVTSNYVYHNITGEDKQALLLETLRVLKKGGTFAIHDLMSPRRYGDMQAFVQKLRNMGYERVELIDQTEITKAVYKEAPADGYWFPEVCAGQKVLKEALLGRWKSSDGTQSCEVRARFAGRVLYETTALGVRRNDPLIAYGTA